MSGARAMAGCVISHDPIRERAPAASDARRNAASHTRAGFGWMSNSRSLAASATPSSCLLRYFALDDFCITSFHGARCCSETRAINPGIRTGLIFALWNAKRPRRMSEPGRRSSGPALSAPGSSRENRKASVRLDRGRPVAHARASPPPAGGGHRDEQSTPGAGRAFGRIMSACYI